MGNRFINPDAQYMNSTPVPYSGGALFFYLTGTSTKTDTYTTSALSVANANPVVLDSAGQPTVDIFLDPAVTYKVVLVASGYDDPPTSAVKTWDPVVDPAANVTAAIQVVAGTPNGALAGSQGSPGGSAASMAWDITNHLMYVCTTTGTALTAVWTQVAANLAGQIVKTGIISPTSLGVDKDDYAPTDNITASVIRQDASASVSITGLAGASSGVLKTIHNVSADKTITLVDGAISTASAAANRFDFGGSNIVLYPDQSVTLWYDEVTLRWRQEGTFPQVPVPIPGGRLTLTTGTPVLSADTTGVTTVYYTPYIHGYVPVYNGTHWSMAAFSELSQTLADATKSPAAAAASSCYDMFVWNDAGTIRCTRGPAWTNITTRSAGTALVRVNGVLMNSLAITNGPAASRGVYVGTISTSATGGNGDLNMMFAPAAAAGGGACRLDVWNMYHRVRVASTSKDSTDTWAYTVATWRAANAAVSSGTNNRITAVCGLSEDMAQAIAVGESSNPNGGVVRRSGVGLDSTSAFSGFAAGTGPQGAGTAYSRGDYLGLPGLGSHFFQLLEFSDASGVSTWQGDNGAPTAGQTGISLSWMM